MLTIGVSILIGGKGAWSYLCTNDVIAHAFFVDRDTMKEGLNKIKNIWTKFIDVQDQLLKLRQESISVLPNSITTNKSQLKAVVDETCKTDRIISDICNIFKISEEEIDKKNGEIPIASEIPSEYDLLELERKASSNYVRFYTSPSFHGVITKNKSLISYVKGDLCNRFDVNFDRKGRMQASLESFQQIDNELLKQYDINLNAIGVGMFEIKPNLAYYLSLHYPLLDISHKTKHYYNQKTNKQQYSLDVEITNFYFTNSVLETLHSGCDFFLKEVYYTFTIDNLNLSATNRLAKLFGENFKDNHITLKVFPIPKENDFFHKDKDTSKSDNLWESDWNTDWNFLYTLHKRSISKIIGDDSIKFESRFIYSYNKAKFESDFLPSLELDMELFWESIGTQNPSRSISVSEDRSIIGIDFNWRDESLKDIICLVANEIGIINFSMYSDHKFNIDLPSNDIDLSTIEAEIKESFPAARTTIDHRNGVLNFYQGYTQSTKSKLFRMLSDYVRNFDKENIKIEFPETLPKNDYFYFDIEENAQREHLETRIRELLGSTLCVNDRVLGTLTRVNYPNITVDISDSEIENIDQLIDAGALSYLTPNLTGDIEKMHRLKDSLNRIIKGDRVNNKYLSEFIFDSSKARCIDSEELAVKLHSQGEYYADINAHLLNRRVNESQIEAVIKTLLAEDLALIQGPPGTGKSTAIAEIIWQHIRKNQNERILLTSETNLAVDNAIDRVKSKSNNLVKPIRFGDGEKLENEGKQFSLDAMKQWVESAYKELDCSVILDHWGNNIANRVSILPEDVRSKWSNILLVPDKQHREWFFEQYVKNCNVIGATCSSIGDFNSKKRPTSFFRSYCEVYGKISRYTDRDGIERETHTSKDGIKFTTVIQDESSKATPAELSLPLIYGKKSIVIGDHRQLPPMLDREEFISSMEYLLTKVTSPKEQKSIEKLLKYVKSNFNELEISHFERLFNNIDCSLKGLFNLQYRMHPDINEVIKQFYVEDGGLQCGLNTPVDLGVDDPNMSNPSSRYHGIDIDGLLCKDNHVLWIDTDSPEMLEGTSRVNYGEVDAIKWILSQFEKSESYMNYQDFWNNEEDKQIGVISFYGKQLKLLNELKSEFSHLPMRISTVDRFQGMERNIIIVSMVRSTTIANNNNQRPDYELYGELGYQEQTDLGFAKSPNRLNVALSRAKRLLIIVGNSTLYRQNSIYDNVYNAIANNPNGRIIKYPHNDR